MGSAASGASTHHTALVLAPAEVQRRALERPNRVTLTTQVSLDRWERFAQQACAWGGPVSVAAFVPVPQDHPLAPRFLDALRQRAASLQARLSAQHHPQHTTAAAAAPLTVTALHANHVAREGATVVPGCQPVPEQQMRYSLLYPINALRNLALEAAATDHVLLVDGDFMPSLGLRELLEGPQSDHAAGGTTSSSTDSSGSGSSGSPSQAPAQPTTGLLGRMPHQAPPLPVMSAASASSSRGNIYTGGSSDSEDLPFGPPSGPRGSSCGPGSAPYQAWPVGPEGRAAAGSSGSGARPVMWVLPAFELSYGQEVPDDMAVAVPRTKQQLARLASGSGPVAPAAGSTGDVGPMLRPFHCGRYPMRQPAWKYGEWMAAVAPADEASDACGSSSGTPGPLSSQQQLSTSALGSGAAGLAPHLEGVAATAPPAWLQAEYVEFWEPYGVVRKDQVPRYDESFRGYGLNKVQHAYHMAAAGFEFRVLTQHFLVTVPHARSPSHGAMFGTAADPSQRATVEGLYRAFKSEMAQRYGFIQGSLRLM